MDDCETISHAIDGDEVAQQELYETHYAAAFRLASLLLGNVQDAEEVVQDAFVYALSNLRRFDPARCSFFGWLRVILVSRCRNRYRHRRRPMVSLDELEESGSFLAEANREPAHWLEELDGRRRIWQALQRVSIGAREALILRYYQDLPYSEVAIALGCSVEAARARVAHGKVQLRRWLGSTANGTGPSIICPEVVEGQA